MQHPFTPAFLLYEIIPASASGLFDGIPAALQRHEKKFRMADIQSTARFREYETSFFWLDESQVINIYWGASEPSVGLRMKMDSQQVNKGMLVENMVAQMLRANGHKLCFYSQYSENAEERMEIDFLIQKPSITSRHNISPIEVKFRKKFVTSRVIRGHHLSHIRLFTSCLIRPNFAKSE